MHARDPNSAERPATPGTPIPGVIRSAYSRRSALKRLGLAAGAIVAAGGALALSDGDRGADAARTCWVCRDAHARTPESRLRRELRGDVTTQLLPPGRGIRLRQALSNTPVFRSPRVRSRGHIGGRVGAMSARRICCANEILAHGRTQGAALEFMLSE